MSLFKRICLAAVGILLLFFLMLLMIKGWDFTSSQLGLLTLALGSLLISFFNPIEIGMSGISMKFQKIENDISRLRKELRPLAFIDYQSGKMVYSSFDSNQLIYKRVKNLNDAHDWEVGTGKGFQLKLFGQRPSFVEIRSKGSSISFSEHIEDGIHIYDAAFGMAETNEEGEIIDQIVFEAYY